MIVNWTERLKRYVHTLALRHQLADADAVMLTKVTNYCTADTPGNVDLAAPEARECVTAAGHGAAFWAAHLVCQSVGGEWEFGAVSQGVRWRYGHASTSTIGECHNLPMIIMIQLRLVLAYERCLQACGVAFGLSYRKSTCPAFSPR